MALSKRKYKIITDSCCDLPYEDEKKYGIDIMPFQIALGNECFWERESLTPQEYLQKIDTSEYLPKTSQITVFRFEERFMEYFSKGYKELFVILINSTGSATYANALQAAENIADKIRGKMKVYVVDSHSYSVAYGYAVREAAKKLENGDSAASVLAYLDDWFSSYEIYIIAFSLRHLKKSGRVSAAAAFLGELMGMRPVISLIDGESVVVKKSRGDKSAITEAVEYISQRAVPETPWQILRTTVPELEDTFIKQYEKKVGSAPSMISYSGGAVSANAGTKMIGVVIKGRKRK